MTKDERLAAQNECQVLKLLHHPHIIEYYENFLEDKALMIAMEYAPGRGTTGGLPTSKGRGALPTKGLNPRSSAVYPRSLLALKGRGALSVKGLNPGSNGQVETGGTGHLLVSKWKGSWPTIGFPMGRCQGAGLGTSWP